MSEPSPPDVIDVLVNSAPIVSDSGFPKSSFKSLAKCWWTSPDRMIGLGARVSFSRAYRRFLDATYPSHLSIEKRAAGSMLLKSRANVGTCCPSTVHVLRTDVRF